RGGVHRARSWGRGIGAAGWGGRRAGIVVVVIRDARRRHVIGVGVIAEARAEPPVGGWMRRQVPVVRDTRSAEPTSAPPSPFVRGSAITGSAELIVNGCSGSSLLQSPYEKKPVTWVLCASLLEPPEPLGCGAFNRHRDTPTLA